MNERIDVLAVMRELRELADAISEGRPEEEEQVARADATIAALAELIEAAGKAQDTNRDDYVLCRPERGPGFTDEQWSAFLLGFDTAADRVFRTGLRAALARVQGECA